MENALKINGLVKKYKDFTLGEISTVIPSGFATALIGANGAGKTTLIDTICGVTGKTSGNIVYFDNMTDIDSADVRNRIGYCSSSNFFPFDWNLKYIANSMEIAFDGFSREKFGELCKKFKLGDINEKKQKKLVKMSDGNRMRTYLAAVLARETNLLVLDEPTTGVDPLARRQFWDLIIVEAADEQGASGRHRLDQRCFGRRRDKRRERGDECRAGRGRTAPGRPRRQDRSSRGPAAAAEEGLPVRR